jgi:hypothetical protein
MQQLLAKQLHAEAPIEGHLFLQQLLAKQLHAENRYMGLSTFNNSGAKRVMVGHKPLAMLAQ